MIIADRDTDKYGNIIKWLMLDSWVECHMSCSLCKVNDDSGS